MNGETGHYEGDEFVPTVPSQAGLLLDTLIVLPRLSSGALRKIADDCEKLIAGLMEDGVFE